VPAPVTPLGHAFAAPLPNGLLGVLVAEYTPHRPPPEYSGSLAVAGPACMVVYMKLGSANRTAESGSSDSPLVPLRLFLMACADCPVLRPVLALTCVGSGDARLPSGTALLGAARAVAARATLHQQARRSARHAVAVAAAWDTQLLPSWLPRVAPRCCAVLPHLDQDQVAALVASPGFGNDL